MKGMIIHITRWTQEIQTKHGVDPWIFLVLLVLCAPFFYYSLYRLGRAGVKRDPEGLKLWSFVFLLATSGPYIYVIVFGHDIPWFIYLAIAILLIHGLWSLASRLRKGGV